MVKVDIERFRSLCEEVSRISSLPLEEIEWVENGEKVEIDPKRIEEWKITGLGPKHFILTEFYKKGWAED